MFRSVYIYALTTVAALIVPRGYCFSIPALVVEQNSVYHGQHQQYRHCITSSCKRRNDAFCLFLSPTTAHDYLVDDAEMRKASSISSDILVALRSRTGGDVEVDFYDTITHLHSEGVWHNALVGIAALEDTPSSSRMIAESLYKHSWDGVSFQRRVWSGSWDHSRLDSDSTNPPAQANYYRDSNEHRCVQHGMALIFWSLLSDSTESSSKIQEEQHIIANAFIDQFWNGDQWTTVSKSQGGGSVLRPSASAAKKTLNTKDDAPYYRAVDQAIAVLALLAHINVLNNSKQGEQHDTQELIRIVQVTCGNLLSPDGYSYGNIATARSYVGLDRNRNFWHDGWVLLAISCARTHLWTTDSSNGESQLQRMLQGLIDLYGHSDDESTTTSSENVFDGTIWHWPKLQKDDDSNVRYCGDNALLYAISRNLASSAERISSDGFWKFLGELRDNDDGLSSVADAYPQVRLHPNTELAALLVWPNRK